jgi:tRNA-guanine family transglycosylase
MVCRRYSRAYLRHLMQAGEALSGTLNTIHNLAYYLGIMERVRESLNRQSNGYDSIQRDTEKHKTTAGPSTRSPRRPRSG